MKFRVTFEAFSLASVGFTWLGGGILINDVLAMGVGGIIILGSFILLICSFRTEWASNAKSIIDNHIFSYFTIVYGAVAIAALVIVFSDPQNLTTVYWVLYSLVIFFIIAVISMAFDIVLTLVQSFKRFVRANEENGNRLKLLFLWAKANKKIILVLCSIIILVLVLVYKLIPIGSETVKLVLVIVLSWLSSLSADNINLGASLVALLAFVVSMVTLIVTRRQLDLLRKQVFGQLYDKAQVDTLTFILPEKWKCKDYVFKQTDEEINYGIKVVIPIGLDCVLYVRWKWTAAHSFVAYDIGIKDPKPDSLKIVGLLSSFAQQIMEAPVKQLYQDWHGAWHTEFAIPRKMSKGDYFIVPLTVRASKTGSYTLFIEIRVAEAPNYFDELTIQCIDQPDAWATEHWTDDILNND